MGERMSDETSDERKILRGKYENSKINEATKW